MSDESRGYQNESIEIESLEFVGDIADQNMGMEDSVKSNRIVTDVVNYRKLNFLTDKCKVLNVNSKSTKSVSIDNVKLKVKTNFKCLGDIFSCKGNNSD